MIEKVELSWLISFQSVFENGSFKQASEKLELPTSNVSRHVALLEEVLNLRLFERTTRRISVTEAGQKLYRRVSPLLITLEDELEDLCQQNQVISGHLRVLMPDLPVLAKQVMTFCVQHPQLTLSCDTGLAPTEGLLDGFDLVLQFGRGKLDDSDWVATELIRWPSVIVAAPDVAERYAGKFSLENLPKLPCITTFSALNKTPWTFKHGDSMTTHHVSSKYRVNSAHMAKEAALSGLGIAILPRQTCHADIKADKLIVLDFAQQPEDLVLYAYSGKRKNSSKKMRALLKYLKDQNASTNLHPI